MTSVRKEVAFVAKISSETEECDRRLAHELPLAALPWYGFISECSLFRCSVFPSVMSQHTGYTRETKKSSVVLRNALQFPIVLFKQPRNSQNKRPLRNSIKTSRSVRYFLPVGNKARPTFVSQFFKRCDNIIKYNIIIVI